MGKLAMLALLVGCYGGTATSPEPARPVEATTRHARTAADPLGFLPVDAEIVAYLDASSLRQSPLWSRIEPSLMAKAGPALEQFKLACGFDPVPQIERIAIGLRNPSTPQLEGVVVIGGLSRTQLMSCMTRVIRSMPQLARIERNVVLLQTGPDDKPVAFAFADARTLVILAGERARAAQGLRAVLDAGAPLRGSIAFMELFGRVSERNHGWFFLNGAAKMFEGIAALGFHPRAVFGTVDIPAGATAKLYARMPTATEATSFVAMIQGQITALQSLVERFDVASDDVDVVIDIALTEEQLAIGANLLGP